MSPRLQSRGEGGALFALWRMKLLGRVRLLVRRARSPVGLLTALAGLALFALWIGSIAMRSSMLERSGEPPGQALTRVGLMVYLLFVGFSSLSFRGVFVPRPELERLLAGPIGRASIIRYRMVGAITMSLPFVGLMAFLVAPRFQSPAAAVLGIIMFVPTGIVLGQGISLIAARTSGPLHGLTERVPAGALRLVGALGLMGLLGALAFGPGLDGEDSMGRGRVVERLMEERLGRIASESEPSPGLGARLEAFASHPVVSVVTAPLDPWARALTAPSLAGAWAWLGLCFGLFVLSFEAISRIGIDFREASLRTSMDLERRMARVRKGQGGVGAFQGGPPANTRQVPWLAGHGPAGAVVWIRTAWLVRQAQGTLVVVLLVTAGGLLIGTRVFGDTLAETVAVAVLSVVYLAGGLRVDLRADLDRMEILKAWPIPTWRLFAASLVPGTLVTTLVVCAVVLGRAAILDLWDPQLLAVLAGVPPLAFAWIGVDNVVFLLFPVRYVPGQGSAIQHAGRTFLLVILRAVLFGSLLAMALGGAFLLASWGEARGFGLGPVIGLMAGWILGTVLLGFAGLVAFGSWALRRFDVSRVRAVS